MSFASVVPRTITATLNYLLPTEEKPTRWIIDPPVGQPRWSGDAHEVTIEDARDHSERWSLDRNGFALWREPTWVRDFYSPAEIASVYYPESSNFCVVHSARSASTCSTTMYGMPAATQRAIRQCENPHCGSTTTRSVLLRSGYAICWATRRTNCCTTGSRS